MKGRLKEGAAIVAVSVIFGLSMQVLVYLLAAIGGAFVDLFVDIPVLANASIVGNYAGVFAFLCAIYYFYYNGDAAV